MLRNANKNTQRNTHTTIRDGGKVVDLDQPWFYTALVLFWGQSAEFSGKDLIETVANPATLGVGGEGETIGLHFP